MVERLLRKSGSSFYKLLMQKTTNGSNWSIQNNAYNSYTPTNNDVGSILKVTLSYQDIQGSQESLTTSITSSIANPDTPPTGVIKITERRLKIRIDG